MNLVAIFYALDLKVKPKGNRWEANQIKQSYRQKRKRLRNQGLLKIDSLS